MKICFIIPKAYPIFNPKVKSTFGGAEVQLILIGKEIVKYNNCDVHFMVADYGQEELEECGNIKIWKSLNLRDNLARKIFSFYLIFRKVNADIYVQMTLSEFSGIMALYSKIVSKKFVFLLAHDSETDGSHKVYKNFITRFLAQLLFKYSSLIISQNTYQNTNLRRRNIRSIFIKTGHEIPSQKIEKKNYILWVARSDDFKRPLFFLKLAKQSPEYFFIMICPKATNDKGIYQKVKIESRKIENLKFIPFVPFQEIDKYFEEAKVFINTSTQEGFPNTFIQSTKNSTPIISLNVNPDDFLEEFACGFDCKNNFNLMKKYLDKLMTDEILYDKMAKSAFEYAKANHDVKKIAKEIILSSIRK